MGTEQLGVKAIFDEAAEIEDPEARRAYLEQACEGDLELRRHVDALLQAYERPGVSSRDQPSRRTWPRSSAPPYRRLARLPVRSLQAPEAGSARTSFSMKSAKGAWAPSTWPSRKSRSRRRVALKIIKPGMDSSR